MFQRISKVKMPGVSTEQVTLFREVKEIAEKSLNQFSFKLAEWLISGTPDGRFYFILQLSEVF